jgi:NADH dehydrogenase
MNPKICILGGGFAGLYTALKLTELGWGKNIEPDITLIDQNANFLFTPLLYEIVTQEMSSWEISPPFTELLQGTKVRFIQGKIENINQGDREVTLINHQGNNQTLNYDYLVISLGGETPFYNIPGVAENAYTFRTIDDAYQLSEKLRELEQSDRESIRIAIVGAGYSGVELACKIAPKLGDRGKIRLIELGDTILQSSTEFNRQAAEKALEKYGVWSDLETKVEGITDSTISLNYKGQTDTIPVDLVLWTVGTKVNPIINQLDLPKNPQGKLITTPTLQVENHPQIFALGDLALTIDESGKTVPSTAQSALQQADFAAWNIWAMINSHPLLSFRYNNLGEMLSLGLDNATMSGLGVELDGPLAYLTRRLVYLYRLPTLEHQIKVGLNWLTKPLAKIINS